MIKKEEEWLSEDLTFSALFDLDQIQRIQDAFADATGVASLITDVDGNPLTRPSNFCRLCRIIRATDKGSVNCMRSDSILGRENKDGPIMQPCLSGGLWDGGTSIIVGGVHIANWLIGQVRDPDMDRDTLYAYAEEIGADMDEYRSALEEVTLMPPERFRKICHYLYLMARQLSDLAYKNLMQKKANREKEELQEKLSHKSKMDAIGHLTGGIAHDFNNMLGGILGASLFLKSNVDNWSEENLQFIDLIIETANRAADLTGKLLTFSRKGTRVFRDVDIRRILEETIAILERSIDKKITVKIQDQAERTVISGNSADLQSSFLNLGINASHAMSESGGELFFSLANVTIGTAFSADNNQTLIPGEYIRITIRDSGCGIPPENLGKIFEPFFTTKQQGRGTGLGLSTVYGVVESHGGAINVYSEVDLGTEFQVFLPLSANSEGEIPGESVQEKIKGTGRIYLIDDEEVILITGSALLRESGYDVETFINPLEAIESFRANPAAVDLIITDMVMPECSGIDLFYSMKEIDSNCRVVISSGFSQNENLNRLRKDGLCGYIGKPFSDVELSRLVSEVLE